MKRILYLAVFLLPMALYGQVSNPSIIPVASAPSGACSVNLPDQQVVFLGTVYTCQSGTWAALSGGGGSLPSAAVGQFLTNTNGSTTYGAQPNVFYQQSGDTIASIEAKCSSLCGYRVTSPQTITLAANHTLSSNVVLLFDAQGSWTVNGSGFTLTIPTQVAGTLTTHFPAGSGSVALGANNSLVPIEWFGAVGDWNGTTGTDNTAAIQACVNATLTGQCLAQALPYAVNGTINFKSGVGFAGTNYGYYTSGSPTRIVNESASANTFSAIGTSSVYFYGNKFDHFSFERSVLPTSTAANLYTSFVGALVISYVSSADSFRNYYFHGDPGDGLGIIEHSQALWGYSGLTETAGTYCGFCVDSLDGQDSPSIKFFYDTVSNAVGSGITTYGMDDEGTQLEDIQVDHFETAKVTQGVRVVGTGSGTNTASDMHFTNNVHDGFYGSAFYISGVTAAQGGSLEITNSDINSANNSGGPANDVESSAGVTFKGNQICMTFVGNCGTGITANNSDGILAANNTIVRASVNPIIFNNTSHSAIVGNPIKPISGAAPTSDLIRLDGTSSYDTVAGNALGGYGGGWGIFTNTGTSNNTVVGNAVDATHLTSGGVGMNGTTNTVFNNGAGFPASMDTTGLSTGTPAYRAIGALNFSGWNVNAVTEGWALGFTVPAGTAGCNPIFSYYNASAWASAWFIDCTTGNLNVNKSVVAPAILPGVIYSAAGTALPTCAVGIKGEMAVVSDATIPMYMGAYTSGGLITTAVICSYNGTTYSWLTH